MLTKGITPPSTLVKVMENCSAQNKSNTSAKFDLVVSLLLIPKVVNLYLKPGHSHMRADAVVGQSKALLRGKNWYDVGEMAQRMSQGTSMEASVVKEFCVWDDVLAKHFGNLPGGFTRMYKWEFEAGELQLFRAATDEAPQQRIPWVPNAAKVRAALLHDLLRLPATAQLSEIVATDLVLGPLPKIALTQSKIRSLAEKYPTIPEAYKAYFPVVAAGEEPRDDAGGTQAAAAAVPAAPAAPLAPPQRRVGRPPNPRPVEQGSQSLLQMWASQSQRQ